MAGLSILDTNSIKPSVSTLCVGHISTSTFYAGVAPTNTMVLTEGLMKFIVPRMDNPAVVHFSR